MFDTQMIVLLKVWNYAKSNIAEDEILSMRKVGILARGKCLDD